MSQAADRPFLSVADIRRTFLDFFARRGHTVVPSSPLIPGNDPTLMFTNSGMVQFKDVFLGTDKRPYVRAASVQACLRAGGKHNDLENVGYTARHHTFFEMLGNWSFGDYFKRESLKWSWELLTEVFRLPPERLWATVYHEDDESYDIWTKEIGLPPERVVRIGDNKGGKYQSDNFWMMADTGPCGPCSEIFYDHGPEVAGGPPGSAEADGDRYIEIWNNVFMQFDMQPDGSVRPLPAPCVDTGMGLERIAAILQGVHSNYEIDLFRALIAAAARETGATDLTSPSLRVIADHIRATAFLVADGVIPGNEGRGYVQRRIIRRAIRHGYKLGCKAPFFHRLVPDLVAQMGEAYPNLAAQQPRIMEVLRAEEERFYETLENGMAILDAALAGGQGVLEGEVAFKLHDTYGFPLDLTQDVCRERGVAVDLEGFEAAMQCQKEQARAAGKFRMERVLDYAGPDNRFVGYEHLRAQGKVVALYHEGTPVAELKAGQRGIVVLDETPFYAESGGQVGDRGVLESGSMRFEVHDTQKIKAGVHGHHGVVAQGVIAVGDHVTAQVDGQRRAATMRHHSATHLLHKALREVLGEHVQQKGSLVDHERTRFDFSHHAPLTPQEIAAIEARVNAEILANAATQARVMPLEQAKALGAMMLFGEKYGETVRVLDIGSSRELCGGTHVARTGDIGLFKIVAESGVAAGIRRVEAVAGERALAYLQQLEAQVAAAAAALKAPVPELVARIEQTQQRVRELEKTVEALKGKLAGAQADELAAQAVAVGDVRVLAARLDGADAKVLREAVDRLKTKLGRGVVVLASVEGGKVQLCAGVTPDLVARGLKAGELVGALAARVGGKGGGKPDLAMAGGSDAAALPAALDGVAGWVQARLGLAQTA
ncbi:Alanine--tRNA ligase [Tepidimonas sediminis]|uniref:Alanine--tRNA ligase n=1 Tax=Tepidimonas sediminis TaxID=2588941 RepID=A0A554WNE2_9BURK|nr:alanine--tRNA ligase [Tepidimonas sediminis]TSE25090.1 Alanine--tRNA ligase [Tepidimonas sediminis]